jgi:hypothetical protein
MCIVVLLGPFRVCELGFCAASETVQLYSPLYLRFTAVQYLLRRNHILSTQVPASRSNGVMNDKLIKETQLVWIKYTRSRAECYTHDT